MTTEDSNSATRIRALNDAFRRSFVGGVVVITAGIEAMPADQRRAVLAKVRAFDVFSDDNDPYHEHDFGTVEDRDAHFFWKINYYDEGMELFSPDPADPTVTTRVLTVMLIDEY
jgi:hypothetical protein